MTDEYLRSRERELEWLNSGRVTTDTVHRRFQKPKTEYEKRIELNELNNKPIHQEEYFCVECRCGIDATSGVKYLTEHFNAIRHKHYENCVYCSKPAYFYKYKGKVEVYHYC